MPNESFKGSDDYADEVHQLYTAGRYDDALSLIKEALQRYPWSSELHVGLGYVRLARHEFAWALQTFEDALALDPNHEDGVAGYGEALLKVGRKGAGVACFEQLLALGFGEDHDLMLQVGRALFREGVFDHARRFFETIVSAHEDSAEAAACLGYAAHRLGDDPGAMFWLEHALRLDADDTEARIYLGNLLYDQGRYDEALAHYSQTEPADHWEELAMWRVLELKKSVYGLNDRDPEVRSWLRRFEELATERNVDDALLAQIEATLPDGSIPDPRQLDLFGTLLSELQRMKKRDVETQQVALADGTSYAGTWEDIVLQMKQDDREWAGGSVRDYMQAMARKSTVATGVRVPATDAESFLRGVAAAGLLTIRSPKTR